jgi:hypothetical protein
MSEDFLKILPRVRDAQPNTPFNQGAVTDLTEMRRCLTSA